MKLLCHLARNIIQRSESLFNIVVRSLNAKLAANGGQGMLSIQNSGHARSSALRLGSGTLLQDVVGTFDLITNDDDNHICNMDTWTFESSCGLRRRIDFIMCSQEMRFTSAHATCNLDLGSDHRAVTVSLDLGFRRRKDRKCFRCVKRWKPPLDPQGVPHTYHAILQDELGVKKPTTLNGLEDVLQQSVRRINTTSKLPKPKPVWQDAVLQDLLQ